MTFPTLEDGKLVHVPLTLDEAQQLQAVVPWLLQALEERPNLTAKQRQRRSTARVALGTLLSRVAANVPPPHPADAADDEASS
jgi:hypothetical protein